MWWKFHQWPGMCCKEVCCSQAEVRAVLTTAACHEKRGGSSWKNVYSWKKLSRDHLIFNGNPGSSQPGQTEAARRHFHGDMCLEYPNPWKAVFILSTAFVYQLDLSQAAVKKNMNFSGSKIKILGKSRQCQENLWTASWKQFYCK